MSSLPSAPRAPSDQTWPHCIPVTFGPKAPRSSLFGGRRWVPLIPFQPMEPMEQIEPMEPMGISGVEGKWNSWNPCHPWNPWNQWSNSPPPPHPPAPATMGPWYRGPCLGLRGRLRLAEDLVPKRSDGLGPRLLGRLGGNCPALPVWKAVESRQIRISLTCVHIYIYIYIWSPPPPGPTFPLF